MNRHSRDEDHFEVLSTELETSEMSQERAPSRLKSKIYSTLMGRMEAEGPLSSVSETKTEGRGLCVFEELVRIAPVGERAKSANFCKVCHARKLAEALEKAPIYWGNCPYVAFQNR